MEAMTCGDRGELPFNTGISAEHESETSHRQFRLFFGYVKFAGIQLLRKEGVTANWRFI